MLSSTTSLRRIFPLFSLAAALSCARQAAPNQPSGTPSAPAPEQDSQALPPCGQHEYRVEGGEHCFRELSCTADLRWSRREHSCLPPPPGKTRQFTLFLPPSEASFQAPTPLRAGTALWTAQALSELKATLKGQRLLATSFPVGASVYEGSLLEVVAAWRSDTALAREARERLQALIDSPDPDALSSVEAMFLQARITYALFARLYDSSPRLFDAEANETMRLADESGEPSLEEKAMRVRSEVAAKWVQRRAEELNASATYFVPRLAWALQYATAMGAPEEMKRSMQRLLYALSLELIGLEQLLPPDATTALQFIASAKTCPEWEPGAGADFVPKNLVATPNDPHSAFTLREASAGLSGRGPLIAELTTSLGSLSCELYSERAPYTVANFVGLARGLRATRDPRGTWSKREAYAGTPFHRIIKGFMAQGGDPTGSGAGDPGYVIPNEEWQGTVFNRRGLLAMANRGPNTNGMQFFITDAAAPHLNQGYTIFGFCEPNETLTRLMNLPTDARDRPLELPLIKSINIKPEFTCRKDDN